MKLCHDLVGTYHEIQVSKDWYRPETRQDYCMEWTQCLSTFAWPAQYLINRCNICPEKYKVAKRVHPSTWNCISAVKLKCWSKARPVSLCTGTRSSYCFDKFHLKVEVWRQFTKIYLDIDMDICYMKITIHMLFIYSPHLTPFDSTEYVTLCNTEYMYLLILFWGQTAKGNANYTFTK